MPKIHPSIALLAMALPGLPRVGKQIEPTCAASGPDVQTHRKLRNPVSGVSVNAPPADNNALNTAAQSITLFIMPR